MADVHAGVSLCMYAVLHLRSDHKPASDVRGPILWSIMQVEGAVAELRAGYALARERVRKASGMRVLLALLHARASMTAQASHALRTLAVKCLVGLAHDPALRHILSKLQVCLLSSRLKLSHVFSLPSHAV